jgi:hypothetical protein
MAESEDNLMQGMLSSRVTSRCDNLPHFDGEIPVASTRIRIRVMTVVELSWLVPSSELAGREGCPTWVRSLGPLISE